MAKVNYPKTRSTSRKRGTIGAQTDVLPAAEVQRRRAAWKALQEYMKPFGPKPGEKPLSEQLIEERRAEAKREGY